ncbi:MAG: multidrug transporter subunit MdtC [Betaproteobacteria bacterium]|nr:multidrug transporter subunit MdtC [Betaproteobacteria bacterium]NBY07542.1 multidrug transporter subunit MdtC [Betaproteobacteria bacterium]
METVMISSPFVARPIATTLVALGVALAGVLAYFHLPVSPLPQVEFPTISVQAAMPGASPETMAATVATPLERALGAIAGVNEMTSYSSQGNSRVTLQFDLSRDINGAARDVQAAINASRSMLPSGMPSNPTYRKVNPADAPMMILALTSDTLTRGQMYDVASTYLSQRLAQIDGVGQVTIGGGALPAVRIALDPEKLTSYGVSLETIRTAAVATNVNKPKGFLDDKERTWQIEANDQAFQAKDYASLIIKHINGQSLRLKDVADVTDSVQDLRTYGAANGKPSILLVMTLQPGSNVIDAVDRVRAILPQLQASIPQSMRMDVVSDRTPSIRASLYEIQKSLAISVGLVVLVVALFLKHWRTAVIPVVAVPLSLAATFGVMYLLGYSLNNLTLMAMTIATGFVVDDAIVVLENISRHRERGKSILQATLDGTQEIGFTVLSISISLVAVFIPIIFMGGVLGRLFREFAVVLSVAILVSMVVSLTLTPMMCANVLKNQDLSAGHRKRSRLQKIYRSSLGWALRHQWLMWLMLIATIALNVSLYKTIPKGMFPQQDNGRIFGSIRADQSSSFQAMQARLDQFMAIVRADPAVEHVTGFTGGGQRNSAQMFLSLKPRKDRDVSADQVVARLRIKLAKEAGARLFLVPAQDIRIGGRMSSSQYEYTIKSDDLEDLRVWEPKLRRAFTRLKEIDDINTDYEDRGLQNTLVIDRDAASRLGLSVRAIDQTLSNAFSQRQIGVIYNPLNQYRVVLELAPEYLQSPESLKKLQFINDKGQAIPLAAFASVELTNSGLYVSHDGGVPSDTFSFNLSPNVSLSQATTAIEQAVKELNMPITVRGSFSGTANSFQKSLSTQPMLILAAFITLYLVLGMLYESLLHPITILSTLPSAGVGALLALMAFDTEFSVVALIGVILLIGIVKKNAILMIDFALVRQRKGKTPAQAIYQAAQLRLRPILMTTAAAMLGALPLALGSGDGAELRRPLGLSVVGGLILSQLLTLYTTPVVFVALENIRTRMMGPRPSQLPLDSFKSNSNASPSLQSIAPLR